MNREELLDLVRISIKHQALNKLFSETIFELRQKVITLKSEKDFDLLTLIKQLVDGELLISDANYSESQRDFSVIDASGEVILTISPDGRSINNKEQEFFLEDPSEMKRLLDLYNTIEKSDAAITIEIDN
jgi:hypothetical protein